MNKAYEIQLPDYLPSRYKSWFHLYLEVKNEYEKAGYPIDEETKVKLYTFFDRDEVSEQDKFTALYQEWPLVVLKARALDYVISKLPDIKTLHEIRGGAFQFPPANSEYIFETLHNLMDISIRK